MDSYQKRTKILNHINAKIFEKLRNGVPVDQLAREYKGKVSEITIMRWKKLLGIGAEERLAALKEEILEKLRNGISVDQLAREYKGKVSEITIMQWKKEAGIESPDTTEPENNTDNNGETPKPVDTKDLENATDKIIEACDALRSMDDWPEVAEDMVLTELLPLLETKSPKVAEVLKIKGYDTLLENLQSQYEGEKKEHESTKKTSFERQALNEQLAEELNDRKSQCKRECAYSKQWVAEQLHNSLDLQFERLSKMKSALLEGQYTTRRKTKIKMVETVIYCPKKARELALDIAMDAAYTAVTHLEWLRLQSLHSEETIDKFYKFLKVFEELNFADADLMARIRAIEPDFS